jgi:hypothetical protein
MRLPEFALHDLRRVYAQLGYEAGTPLTQISNSRLSEGPALPESRSPEYNDHTGGAGR